MAVNLSDLPPRVREQVTGKLLQSGVRTEDTLSELRAAAGQHGAGAGKYRNKKAVRMVDEQTEIVFDSQKEARRFDELLLMLRAGRIRDLKLQPEFTLREAYTTEKGYKIRAIRYRADFSYMERVELLGRKTEVPKEKETDVIWRLVVEDVKSEATKTRVYAVKRKLMVEKYGIVIREV